MKGSASRVVRIYVRGAIIQTLHGPLHEFGAAGDRSRPHAAALLLLAGRKLSTHHRFCAMLEAFCWQPAEFLRRARAGGRRPEVWVAALVAFGLFLRLELYLSNPSIWHDEGWLVLNLLEKGYAELLGPLKFDQAAPPLFLWIERGMIDLLGDSTSSLRLLPLLASCAALLLLAHVGGRTLGWQGALGAVLLCACSERMLWHTSEVKPYAVDVFVAAVFLWLFEAEKGHSPCRQLGVWIVVTTLAMLLSYPAFFLCGGLLVALLPGVWRNRGPAVLLLYGLLSLVIAGVICSLLTGPIHAQQTPFLQQYWQGTSAFPNWDKPSSVPAWLVGSTFMVLDYACRPLGGCLSGFALVGAVVLWREGRQPLVALLVVPVGLAALAGLMGRYPYHGSRLMLYALPAVCLLVGAGVPVAWTWLRSRQPRLAPLLLIPLAAPLVMAGYRLASPCKRSDCVAAVAYIESQRQAGDEIVGDNPAFHYYFRQRPAGYHRMAGAPQTASRRLWVATTPVLPAELSRFEAETSRDGWRVAQRTEFLRASVLLLVRDPGIPQQARATEPESLRAR